MAKEDKFLDAEEEIEEEVQEEEVQEIAPKASEPSGPVYTRGPGGQLVEE